jgi:hypothetical protein
MGDRQVAKVLLSQRYFPRLRELIRSKLFQRIRDDKDVSVLDSVLNSLVDHHGTAVPAALDDANSVWDLIARITLRHCDKHNKRSQRAAERLGPVLSIGPGETDGSTDRPAVDPPDDGLGPEAEAELADLLAHFLGQLNPRQQQVFQFELEGLSRLEIKTKLRVSMSTVDKDRKIIRDKLNKLSQDL